MRACSQTSRLENERACVVGRMTMRRKQRSEEVEWQGKTRRENRDETGRSRWENWKEREVGSGTCGTKGTKYLEELGGKHEI